jgi:hypothetical protein
MCIHRIVLGTQYCRDLRVSVGYERQCSLGVLRATGRFVHHNLPRLRWRLAARRLPIYCGCRNIPGDWYRIQRMGTLRAEHARGVHRHELHRSLQFFEHDSDPGPKRLLHRPLRFHRRRRLWKCHLQLRQHPLSIRLVPESEHQRCGHGYR